MTISIWKDAPHVSPGKYKWTQQQDTTTHLLERQKSGMFITPTAGKNMD
jgi:hypothetical protein